MKRRMGLPMVVVTAGFLAACSGEEELHSGPPCFEGQHQERKDGDENIRCKCVEDDAGAGSDGAGSDDGGAIDGAGTDANAE